MIFWSERDGTDGSERKKKNTSFILDSVRQPRLCEPCLHRSCLHEQDRHS